MEVVEDAPVVVVVVGGVAVTIVEAQEVVVTTVPVGYEKRVYHSVMWQVVVLYHEFVLVLVLPQLEKWIAISSFDNFVLVPIDSTLPVDLMSSSKLQLHLEEEFDDDDDDDEASKFPNLQHVNALEQGPPPAAAAMVQTVEMVAMVGRLVVGGVRVDDDVVVVAAMVALVVVVLADQVIGFPPAPLALLP